MATPETPLDSPEETEPDDEPDNSDTETETESETEAPSATGVQPDEKGEPIVDEGFVLCGACHGAGQLPAELQSDSSKETCGDCNGHGVMLSGAVNPDHAIIDCPTCFGNGYVDKGMTRLPTREWVPPTTASEPPSPLPQGARFDPFTGQPIEQASSY